MLQLSVDTNDDHNRNPDTGDPSSAASRHECIHQDGNQQDHNQYYQDERDRIQFSFVIVFSDFQHWFYMLAISFFLQKYYQEDDRVEKL